MIRPTRRAVLLFALGVPVALLLVIAAPGLWPLSFDYGLFVLAAVGCDALLSFPHRLLVVKIDTPERIYIGERGDAAVTIAPTRHRRATRFELVAEQRGALEPPERVAVRLEPGSRARALLALVPRRRGRIAIDRIWARWQGPLGLVLLTQQIPAGRAVDVLPNVSGVQGETLRFLAHEALFGMKTMQQTGEGTEFEALREYTHGLDSRFIDWKHSARHRKLVGKEFRTERNHPVILAFDTGYLMSEPMEGMARLDHAINAGLLLAWVSLRGGDLVGIYGFDAAMRHYMRPLRGVASFARLQQTTAALDYRREETNYTLGLAELDARLTRRALVILFTDFVDTVTAELMIDSAERIARRHVVVFVTLRDPLLQRIADAPPESFEAVAEAVLAHDFMRDRRIVFERLERLGIHCLDVPSRALSTSLINRYLLIKQRGLI